MYIVYFPFLLITIVFLRDCSQGHFIWHPQPKRRKLTGFKPGTSRLLTQHWALSLPEGCSYLQRRDKWGMHASGTMFANTTLSSNLHLESRSPGVMVNIRDSPYNDPGSIPSSGGAALIWVYSTLVLMPRCSDGTLNRGLVCVRMHLWLCVDQKEPGWPSESLEVEKHTDMADT